MESNVHLLPTKLVGEKLSVDRVTHIAEDAKVSFLLLHPEFEKQAKIIVDEMLAAKEAFGEYTDNELREETTEALEELLYGKSAISHEELLPSNQVSHALSRVALYDASLLSREDTVLHYPFLQSERATIYKDREFQDLYDTILTDLSDIIKDIRTHGGYPAVSLQQVLDIQNVRAQFDVFDGIYTYDSTVESIRSIHGALPRANVYQISSHARWNPVHPNPLQPSEQLPTQWQ